MQIIITHKNAHWETLETKLRIFNSASLYVVMMHFLVHSNTFFYYTIHNNMTQAVQGCSQVPGTKWIDDNDHKHKCIAASSIPPSRYLGRLPSTRYTTTVSCWRTFVIIAIKRGVQCHPNPIGSTPWNSLGASPVSTPQKPLQWMTVRLCRGSAMQAPNCMECHSQRKRRRSCN